MKIAPGRRKQQLQQQSQQHQENSTSMPTTAIVKDELWLPEHATIPTQIPTITTTQKLETATGTVVTNLTHATESGIIISN